jgi:S-formylglutathione hydrolase FrmB
MLRDSSGLKVLSEKQLDSRLIELSVSTAALPGPAKIRLLLPPDYSSNLGRRYPVFYLLHGTSGGASDWTVMGDAEKTTAGLPVIVVMPDIALNDNGGGWCTNWVNGGAYGVPEWETFHVAQLIPWVDQNLRTIGTRQGRAIAGLSQGGFCSMSYAARHPDLFSIALAYSGAPDIAYDQGDAAGSTAIINATEFGLDGVPPNSMFGDRATNEVNWADHDPATLANNLRGLDLFMYVGNGVPGPLDSSPVNPEASLIEGAVHQDTFDFHDRLDALSIPSYYDDYGPGTHSWPYWTRDLQQSIGPIMDDFAHPPPDPAGITYTTADAQYSVYGWEVSMHRPAEEFSTLEDADAQGFAVAGSGSGTVRTPPMFAPGASYAVTLRGTNVSQAATSVADPHGRLSIDVPLGPPNPYQQDTAAAMAAGTTVYTTTVSIQESRQPVSDIPSATLSGSRACLSRRRLTIHAGAPRGARVTVLVNGRRRRFIRVGGGVQLSLAGRTKGTYRVEVRIGARGALRTVTHTFHTCRPGRRGTR